MYTVFRYMAFAFYSVSELKQVRQNRDIHGIEIVCVQRLNSKGTNTRISRITEY